jgi:hypothetical protein
VQGASCSHFAPRTSCLALRASHLAPLLTLVLSDPPGRRRGLAAQPPQQGDVLHFSTCNIHNCMEWNRRTHACLLPSSYSLLCTSIHPHIAHPCFSQAGLTPLDSSRKLAVKELLRSYSR